MRRLGDSRGVEEGSKGVDGSLILASHSKQNTRYEKSLFATNDSLPTELMFASVVLDLTSEL